MTLTQIAKRVQALEETVQVLAKGKARRDRHWYRTHAGRFAGDSTFKKILKLGRDYRKSQRPPRQLKPR